MTTFVGPGLRESRRSRRCHLVGQGGHPPGLGVPWCPMVPLSKQVMKDDLRCSFNVLWQPGRFGGMGVFCVVAFGGIRSHWSDHGLAMFLSSKGLATSGAQGQKSLKWMDHYLARDAVCRMTSNVHQGDPFFRMQDSNSHWRLHRILVCQFGLPSGNLT